MSLTPQPWLLTLKKYERKVGDEIGWECVECGMVKTREGFDVLMAYPVCRECYPAYNRRLASMSDIRDRKPRKVSKTGSGLDDIEIPDYMVDGTMITTKALVQQMLDEAKAKVKEFDIWQERVDVLEQLLDTFDGKTAEELVVENRVENSVDEKPKKRIGRPPKEKGKPGRKPKPKPEPISENSSEKISDEDEPEYQPAVSVSQLSDDNRCDICNGFSLSLSNTRDGRICQQCL